MENFHYSVIDFDKSKPIILALHGTGGDEQKILGFVAEILPKNNIFSVRGKVSENGANRYFARFAEGKLDFEDLAFRTQELAKFLKESPELQNREVIALGYSNGANMAANLLLTDAYPLSGAILLRPMFLPTALENLQLSNTKVVINAGELDPICPADQSKQLAETFTKAGAETSLNLFPTGHNLTHADVNTIQTYFGT